MVRIIIPVLIVIALAAGAAHALGIGGEGRQFGRIGATAGKATPSGPQPTGNIMMVDGTSIILQVDAASFVCRAGGC